MALAVGTKVYLKEGRYRENKSNPLRIVGKIEAVYPSYTDVLWSNGIDNCYVQGDLVSSEGLPNAFWKGFT